MCVCVSVCVFRCTNESHSSANKGSFRLFFCFFSSILFLYFPLIHAAIIPPRIDIHTNIVVFLVFVFLKIKSLLLLFVVVVFFNCCNFFGPSSFQPSHPRPFPFSSTNNIYILYRMYCYFLYSLSLFDLIIHFSLFKKVNKNM